MPELPEVETIRLGLQQKIIGLKIQSVEIFNQKTFQGDEETIVDLKIEKTWRAAKMLGIDLSGGKSLLFHLKMSGQMIYLDGKEIFAGGHPTQDMKDEMPNKSTRVVFTFSDGSKLFFNDQRKFGWIKVVNTDKISDDTFYKGLGPEPLDQSFTSKVLQDRLQKHKNWPIKVAIMDQSTVAGIGNIYAAEACFDAKIDPRMKVSELKDVDFDRLNKAIVRSIQDGIKYGGSSRANFVNAEGEKGLFLDYAYVYNRKGAPCKICKTPIKKLELAGRGTYYCPNCQNHK